MILKWKKRKTQLEQPVSPHHRNCQHPHEIGAIQQHRWEVLRAAWWRRTGGRAIMSQKGEYVLTDHPPGNLELTPGSEDH